MPRYYARLEAADGSGEFRFITLHADSEEEARAIIERREAKLTAFRLDSARIAEHLKAVTGEDVEVSADDGYPSLKDLQDAIKAAQKEGRKIPADVRSDLLIHAQEEPYVLVYFGDSRRPPRAVTGGEEAE